MKRSFFILTILVAVTMPLHSQNQKACCNVSAVDALTETATARETGTGRTFQFKINNAALLRQLRTGSPVYANFVTKQVSLDGKTGCCDIINISAAALAPAAARPVASSAAMRSSPTQLPVMALATGTPQLATTPAAFHASQSRAEARTFTAAVNGKSTSAHLVHVRGLDGIEQAEGLPDGVKELLLMHVKTLGGGEFDDYIVNTELANEWSKTHPVPASIKQAARDKDSHTGCKSFSMHCAGEAGKHAEGQADDLIKQAKGDWDHAASELGHEWGVAADQISECFADKTTNPVSFPVEFTKSLPGLITLDSNDVNTMTKAIQVVNQINSGQSPLDVAGGAPPNNSSSTSSGSGQAAGSAKSPFSESMKGKIVFGFPLLRSTGTMVSADFSYIPCLAFFVRPHSVGVAGRLDIETAITGNAQVTGQYDKTIPLPPADLSIPIQVWPIIIPPAGPPVLEMDLSLFVQGFLEITAKGGLNTNFNLDYAHSTDFDFTCNGKGCKHNREPQSQATNHSSTPAPPPATTSTTVNGELQIQPKIFTGLELNVEFKALQARVGPEAIMEGDVQGDVCLTTANGGSRSTSYALLGELGWTPWMRADTLVINQTVGAGWNQPLGKEQILGVQDLLQSKGGSSALTPTVSGQGKLSAGQAAIYNIKMPGCYPYPDTVQYRVTWTGGSTPSVNPSGAASGTKTPCSTLGNGQATCSFDPKQNLTMAFVWPKADTYTLTVQLVGDNAGREFKSTKPVVMPISVTAN